MTEVVYIPTRGRWDRLEKIVESWHYWGFTVVLVTELDQEQEAGSFYRQHVNKDGDLRILYSTDKPGNGIGWVRNWIVEHAYACGYDSFVMSDDDCYPSQIHVNPMGLLEAVEAYPVLACAASHGQQNHFLGGLLDSHPNEVVLAANGICFQLFAINANRAIKVGNFDKTLKVYEDAEFMRSGIMHGFPWSLHTGVRMVKTGQSGDPGGIQDYIDVRYRESTLVDQTRLALAGRHGGDMISVPPNRPRQSWAKFYDKYMPGWRRYSAGHGGSLDQMLIDNIGG